MIETQFRLMAPTDTSYVLSTWLKSFAKSWEVQQTYHDREAEYFEDYEPVVKRILERSQVIVACLPEEPDIVLGWMCLEAPIGHPAGSTLHYIQVKSRFRGCGIARELLNGLESMPLAYTHVTNAAIAKLRFPSNWHFRPHRRYA